MSLTPRPANAQGRIPHGFDAQHPLQALRTIQLRDNWIDPGSLDALARELGVARTRLTALVDFYGFLHAAPRGDYDLYLSDSVTDRMSGNAETAQALREHLSLNSDGRSADGRVSLSMASCTGLCECGPGMIVNGQAIRAVDAHRASEIARRIAAREPVDNWPASWKAIDDTIVCPGPFLGADYTPGAAIKNALEHGPDWTLEQLEQANLRGGGGAGYPTHKKWRQCRETDAEQRYVVCNADEGEPGTFKDRALLNLYAETMLEGMTACAVTVGATQGVIYLRHEYAYLAPSLQKAIDDRRAAGLLGQNLLGHHGAHFDVEVFMGAGSYVCGEETAMLESLEGRRGIPRTRPPFPTTRGLWGRPTVVNNVETFCYAAAVLDHGPGLIAHDGTQTGWKILSICGDVSRPGIYEFPLGITIGDILAHCGAHDVQAIQVGGPGGTMIAGSDAQRRIASDDLETGGSFIVFDHTRNMLDVAASFTHFFAHESCGFCTPCRVGTRLMVQTVDKIAHGHGARLDVDQIRRLNRVMTHYSHCGLGKNAAAPILSALQIFPDAFEQRLNDAEYSPAFDVDAAIERSRAIVQEEAGEP